MIIFKEVSYSTDSHIKGNIGKPVIAEIDSEQLNKIKIDKNKNITDHLHNFKLSIDFRMDLTHSVASLKGKQKPIDVMGYSPFFIGLQFIVSSNFRSLLNDLDIRTDEYHLEKIKIHNREGDFFLFFSPTIDYDYIDFSKSIFYKNSSSRPSKKYKDSIEFLNDEDPFFKLEKGYLAKSINNRDILNLRSGGLFFSERLIAEIEKRELKGISVNHAIEVYVI